MRMRPKLLLLGGLLILGSVTIVSRITGNAVGNVGGCGGPQADLGLDTLATTDAALGDAAPVDVGAGPPADWPPCVPPQASGITGPVAVPTPYATLDFEDLSAVKLIQSGELSSPQGRTGNALSVQGGIAKVDYAKVLSATSNGGAVAFWVYTGAYNGRQPTPFVLMQAKNDETGDILIRSAWLGKAYQPVAQLKLFLEDKNKQPVNLQAHIDTWNPQEWHHITAAWHSNTAGTVRLFIDGQLRAYASVPVSGFLSETPTAGLYLLSTCRDNPNELNCPKYGYGDGTFLMDRLHGYDHAISDKEVIALYRSELDPSGPTLTAGRTKVSFLGPADGYGLGQLTDTKSNDVLSMLAPTRALWRVQLSAADGSSMQQATNLSRAAAMSCRADPASGAVSLFWTGIEVAGQDATEGNSSLNVHALAIPEADTLAIRLAVTNDTPWTLDAAGITLGGLRSGGANPDSSLVVPYRRVGGSAPNALHTWTTRSSWQALEDAARYPSQEQTMPWLALVDAVGSAAGIYFGAHDPTLAVKAFFWRNSGAGATSTAAAVNLLVAQQPEQGIDLDVVVHAENIGTPGNDLLSNWPVVLRVFDGDWYDAARIYRQWFIQQPRMQGRRLRDRTDHPSWLADAGNIVTTTSWSTITEWEQAMSKATSCGQGCSFDSIFWHMTSWQFANPSIVQTNDLPFYTLGESFKAATQKAHAKGTRVALYNVPTHWDAAQDKGVFATGTIDYNEWNARQGWDLAIRGRHAAANQTPCGTTDPNPSKADNCEVAMCPGHESWRELVVNSLAGGAPFSEDGLLADADGLYLDVLGAGIPALCHSTAHGHPSGGGNHYALGLRQIIANVRNKPSFAPGEHMLYAEGCADSYADLLDGCLSWTYLAANTHALPLVPAVLHDYTQQLGAAVSIHTGETTQSYLARVGHGFVWGIMPGFVTGSFTAPTPADYKKKADILDYSGRVARARRVFKNYLVYGDMLRPPGVYTYNAAGSAPALTDAAPGGIVPVPNFSVPENIETHAIPQVTASLWRDATGTGLVVASLRQTVAYNVYVALDGANIAAQTGMVTASVDAIDPLTGNRTPLSPPRSIKTLQGLTAHLDPLQVLLVEFVDVQQCTMDPAICEDGVACTVDACSATTGCSHTLDNALCNDNVPCTTDACTATGCLSSPQDGLCADDIPCTIDTCTQAGCTTALNHSVCADKVACTVDACTAKGCVSTPQDAACRDKNVCTVDVCTPKGCVSTPQDALCDDKIACTVDRCTKKGCTSTPRQALCNDNIPCTVDSCSHKGCKSTPRNSRCNDKNPRTTDICTAQGCVNKVR